MGHRQHQHLGRNAEGGRKMPGRDVEGPERVRSETVAAAEDAREISLLVDESEGWETAKGGRARRRKQSGSRGKKK